MTGQFESPAEFTARANRLLRLAIAASKRQSEDLSELNRCMSTAKTMKMTWVEGLQYAIDTMK